MVLNRDNVAYLVSNVVKSSSNNEEFITILETLIKEYKAKEKGVPLNLYSNRQLGILEVTVKYLKENDELSNHEIARILNRNDRTIWSTYNKAILKQKEPFEIKAGYSIDPKIFSDRKNAPLKTLIYHLKTQGKTFKEIATTLSRSYKTINSTYNKK